MSKLAPLRRLAAPLLLCLGLQPALADPTTPIRTDPRGTAMQVDASAGQTAVTASPGSGSGAAAADTGHAIKRLLELQQQIAEREREASDLRQEARRLGADATDPEMQKRLTELPKQVQKLRESFEQIAVSGLDLSILEPEPAKEYQWQSELLEIVRPVIGGLKELTEKPRRIEFLRQEIERTKRQTVVIHDAVQALKRLRESDPPRTVARSLDDLQAAWEQRRSETQSNLEVLEFKLATLQGQNSSNWDEAVLALKGFVGGRGTTMVLAITAGLTIWLSIGMLIRLVMRLSRGTDSRRNRKRDRALLYLSRLARVMLVIMATLVVFYLRSDVLLLALSIVALVFLGAGLRQAVPRYIAEIYILLDIGPVREGERIIHGGIPMQIRSIQAFAKLTNPELDGMIRLPLHSLTELVSRPPGCQEESWFPTRPGETVQFADARLAEVISQSVDTVQLRMRGSLVSMTTRDFLAANPLNLSRDGFLVIANFGLDYRHQAICLDVVPSMMREALRDAIAVADFGEHCRDVIVEFSAAGANSLDYLILLPFAGSGAQAFHAAQRLIQRTLVALCNEQGWVIPFGQLTIHQGEGFGRLQAPQRPARAVVEGLPQIGGLSGEARSPAERMAVPG